MLFSFSFLIFWGYFFALFFCFLFALRVFTHKQQYKQFFLAFDSTADTTELISAQAARHVDIQDRVVNDMLKNVKNITKSGVVSKKKRVLFSFF